MVEVFKSELTHLVFEQEEVCRCVTCMKRDDDLKSETGKNSQNPGIELFCLRLPFLVYLARYQNHHVFSIFHSFASPEHHSLLRLSVSLTWFDHTTRLSSFALTTSAILCLVRLHSISSCLAPTTRGTLCLV